MTLVSYQPGMAHTLHESDERGFSRAHSGDGREMDCPELMYVRTIGLHGTHTAQNDRESEDCRAANHTSLYVCRMKGALILRMMCSPTK